MDIDEYEEELKRSSRRREAVMNAFRVIVTWLFVVALIVASVLRFIIRARSDAFFFWQLME